MKTENVIKLKRLFKEKDWNNHNEEEEVFVRICYLLDSLTEEEEDLIIELCERYTWIPHQHYQELIKQVFSKVDPGIFEAESRLFLFPIINPEDEDTTKSGNALLYEIRIYKKWLKEPFKSMTFIPVEQYDKLLDPNFDFDEKDRLFLIDDFIGSGDTLKNTLSQLEGAKKISMGQVYVLSLAAQREALLHLTRLGITYFVEEVFLKGITDYYQEELEKKIRLMQKIEKQLKVLKKFRFGYNASEALVTMARTPNNTFPIFWLNSRKEDKVIEAPFPR